MSTRIIHWHIDEGDFATAASMGVHGGIKDAMGGYIPGFGGVAMASWMANYPTGAHAVGSTVHLMTRFTNPLNGATPFVEWFDDAAWTAFVAASAARFAEGKAMDYDGLAFDEELYSTPFGYPTWEWNYAGNTHTKSQTETQAYNRGRQWMTGILAVWPNVEIITYSNFWQSCFNDYLQHQVNPTISPAYPRDPSLQHHFWRGAFSIHGYGNVWMGDSTFYKGYQIAPPAPYANSFTGACQYNLDTFEALKSGFLSTADVAKLRVVPMVAVGPVNDGTLPVVNGVSTGPFNRQYPADYVHDQLVGVAAAGGGMVVNYRYDSGTYDLSPYASSFQAAAAITTSTPVGGWGGSAPPPPVGTDPAHTTLGFTRSLFSDEFDGALNAAADVTKWSGTGLTQAKLDGSSNLKITAHWTGSAWNSALLSSIAALDGSATYYAEAKIKMAAGTGTNCTAWLASYPNGSDGEEVDAVDFRGTDTLHYNASIYADATPHFVAKSVNAAVDLTAASHAYGAAVYADHVDYYFDEVLVKTITSAEVIAAGGTWTVLGDGDGLAALLQLAMESDGGDKSDRIMLVDYIRVWAPPAVAPPPPLAHQVLNFTTLVGGSDDFTGALSTSPDPLKWTAVTATHATGTHLTGTSHTALDGAGNLNITAHWNSGGGYWESGMLRYATAFDATAGYYAEARIKVASGAAVFNSAWLDEFGGATYKEADFLNQAGGTPTTYDVGMYPDATHSVQKTVSTGVTLSSAYHVYGMAVYADHADFYLDEALVKTITAAEVVSAGGTWNMLGTGTGLGTALTLLMNGSDGGNKADRTMSVDYFRVWQVATTAPSYADTTIPLTITATDALGHTTTQVVDVKKRVPSIPQPLGSLNIKTFGANVDGSSDDTAAVAAAIAAAYTAGLNVYFPPGTTSVSSITAVTGVNLIGAPVTPAGGVYYPVSIIKQRPGAANDSRPVIEGKSFVTLDYLKIDGNRANQPTHTFADAYNNSPTSTLYSVAPAGQGRGYKAGVRGESLTNLYVHRCEITGTYGAAMATVDSSIVTLDSCNIHDTNFEALDAQVSNFPTFLSSGPNGVTCSNNTLARIGIGGTGSPAAPQSDGFVVSRTNTVRIHNNTINTVDRCLVKLEGCTDFEVNNNTATNVGMVQYPGIQVQAESWPGLSGPPYVASVLGSIHDNFISGDGFLAGIQINSSATHASTAKNIEIYNNTVEHTSMGVLTDGAAGLDNIYIHDNHFNNIDGTAYPAHPAIYLNGGGINGFRAEHNYHDGVLMTDHDDPGPFSDSIWLN